MKYLVLVFTINFFGCSIFTKIQPNKKFYNIEVDYNKISKSDKPIFERIRINKLRISPQFVTKEFVYKKDLEYETDFYNQFLIFPSTNITEQLIILFNEIKLSKIVTNRLEGADTSLNIDGNINILCIDFSNSKIQAVLELELYLTDYSKDIIYLKRTYKKLIPIKEANVDNYIKSWNLALTEILIQFIGDLKTIQIQKLD